MPVTDSTAGRSECRWNGITSGNYSIRARATVYGQTYDSPLLALNVTSAPVGVSLTRSYVYDNHQRLCKTIEPESGATLVDYNVAGQIAWSAEGSTLTGTTCDRASVPDDGTSRIKRNRPPRHIYSCDHRYGEMRIDEFIGVRKS